MTDFSPYYPLWGRQLLAEFTNINWQYGLTLTTPVFEISENERQYGSWHSATRVIRISTRLISSHSWDITCQILKHEMAHQICSELFSENDAGHGPLFQKACDLLGLPAPFRLAAGDLPVTGATDPAGNQQTEKGRQFIRRIGKLLALAGSNNEHEAAIAMEKASQLMARHNLQQIQEDAQSEFTSLIINNKSKRLERWQHKICAILLRFFYVKVVTASLYDPLQDCLHKTIEIFGRQENVAIAEYCYAFLAGQLTSLWQENRSRIRGKGIRARNSYYLGVLQGFYDKLLAQEALTRRPRPEKRETERSGAPGMALLIQAEERELDRFVGMRFPRLRRRSGTGAMIYRESYELGRTDGGQIVLHKGVTEQRGEQGLLLSR
ncbi:MAG: SprT-like domain-containing protein [Proteobacteria bacterium]|nr:SprT-like domain-containing protein [Pseudomonadota bacterium]